MRTQIILATALGESAFFGYQGGGGFSTLRNSLATPNAGNPADRSLYALPFPDRFGLKPISLNRSAHI